MRISLLLKKDEFVMFYIIHIYFFSKKHKLDIKYIDYDLIIFRKYK